MNFSKVKAILLAAGKSTRFKTRKSKLLFSICGQTNDNVSDQNARRAWNFNDIGFGASIRCYMVIGGVRKC